MIKDREQSREQMKFAGQTECLYTGDLFTSEIPVWYDRSGKVSPAWLSFCKEERNQTTNLLDRIGTASNLQTAFRHVLRNSGSSGVDGQSVKEFGEWFSDHYQELQAELLTGTYKPQPVKGVRIPKPKGGYRQLGIPTVRDRVVQQAIHQVLQPLYDPYFSPYSYGFRPKRNAHQALQKAGEIIKTGRHRVVDLDLAKFFDEVNHQRLLWLLSTRIGDKRVLSLIGKILKTNILQGGLEEQRIKGTPQGSPLSPLLSNIVLDELDQELMRRGLCFVRYADDLQIFVRSKKASERVIESVIGFIEGRMLLKVNREKSSIKPLYRVNFLGHSFQNTGNLSLSKASEERLKDKIRQITRRNRGVSFDQVLKELTKFLPGWLLYFRHAQMKAKLGEIEGWLRRRLRSYRLKQCKRAIGIARFLKSLKVSASEAWRIALSGKGWWRLSKTLTTSMGMNNQWFLDQGFYSLSDNYKRLHRNLL